MQPKTSTHQGYLTILCDNEPDLLIECLTQKNIDCMQTKGDAASIIIALGGGAGIALIAKQVRLAIAEYFSGVAKVSREKAPRLIVKSSKGHLEITAANAGAIESEILSKQASAVKHE